MRLLGQFLKVGARQRRRAPSRPNKIQLSFADLISHIVVQLQRGENRAPVDNDLVRVLEAERDGADGQQGDGVSMR